MNKNLKAVKKLIVVLVTGCLSFNGVAESNPGNGDADLSISPTKNNTKVVVKAWNLSANAPATIKVLNEYENVMYKEAIENEEKHSKLYDFSQMKPGRYTLVLESETGEVRKPFIVGVNGVIREDKSEAYRQFRPMIIEISRDRSVQVAFNNVTDIPLKLTITTPQGNVLYSEEVAGNQEFNKLINLKKLPLGDYVVNVYNADYSYHREVKNY